MYSSPCCTNTFRSAIVVLKENKKAILTRRSLVLSLALQLANYAECHYAECHGATTLSITYHGATTLSIIGLLAEQIVCYHAECRDFLLLCWVSWRQCQRQKSFINLDTSCPSWNVATGSHLATPSSMFWPIMEELKCFRYWHMPSGSNKPLGFVIVNIERNCSTSTLISFMQFSRAGEEPRDLLI